MEETIKGQVRFFKEFFKKLPEEKEDKNLFIKKFRESSKMNPSFIGIINLLQIYEEFKKLKKDEKKLIVRESVIEFPKTIHLAMEVIVFIFSLIFIVLILSRNILMNIVIIFLLLPLLIYPINLINEHRKRIHYYYMKKYMKNLLIDFYD